MFSTSHDGTTEREAKKNDPKGKRNSRTQVIWNIKESKEQGDLNAGKKVVWQTISEN